MKMNYRVIANRIAEAKGPVPLQYREIQGLFGQKELSEHYKLYEGYWKMLSRVEESIPDVFPPITGVADNPFRALKLAESYAVGGVLLHEMFFQNLTPIPGEININSQLHYMILNQWGSVDQFLQELRGTAIAARGWAVLANCEIDPSYLKIFMLDSHDVGGMFGFSPLIALDVYEHAYWSPWFTDKPGYVDACIKHLNWIEIHQRFEESLLSTAARSNV